MSKTLTVTVNTYGERADKFLSDHYPELSRSRLKQLINDGNITIENKLIKPSIKLQFGQKISILIPDPVESHLIAEDIPLNIIYEDKDILVIDKPPNLTVHPGAGNKKGTLANAILYRCPDLKAINGTIRPGIVHRLDKDTSGLMVVAKNEKSQNHLTNQQQTIGFNKHYIALVHGAIISNAGTINEAIGRNPFNRQKMSVRQDGRKSITLFKKIKKFQKYTLLDIKTITGRTHQIRVHFAFLKHSLVGDKKYGGKTDLINRQFLHANILGFKLPSTNKDIEFKSELPKDLNSIINHLN